MRPRPLSRAEMGTIVHLWQIESGAWLFCGRLSLRQHQGLQGGDCVEKLGKSALSLYRQNPLHRKSWPYLRGEGYWRCTLCQSIDLADSVAKISNWRPMAKFFAVFRRKQSFSTQSGPSCRSLRAQLATHDATALVKGGSSFGPGATDTAGPPLTALEGNLQAPDEGLVFIVIDFGVAISPPFGLDLGTFPFDVVADPSFNSR